ncbi:MAG: O-antigen ligase family protein [Sedimentisphaerales bacterium]
MTLLNSNKKNIGIHVFESALFVILLCIIALRLSFMENPHIESFAMQGTFFDNFLSITISCSLIILFIIWLTVRLFHQKYQPGIFEWGIIIFAAAAIISTIAASNRRDAFNDSLTILSSMLTAVMLAGLLISAERKKILLIVIIGAAVANVYQCTEQFSSSNKLMIEQYEQEPATQLNALGIEPGSFQQMLYEHRLYSKDVRGFFTTGNSAAAIINLAIFGVFAVFDFKTNSKKQLLLPIALLLVLFAGLVMTHSKGGFAALAAAAILLLIIKKFGRTLQRWRITVITAVAILIITGVFAIIGYGLKYNTLPGGNSMLVRWQYWQGAAKIITDNPLLGIGGGNFGTFYTHYKIPAALETVKDPHCFILSLASQFGLIGAIGFCVALFYPIIKTATSDTLAATTEQTKINFTDAVKISGVCTVLTLLFIRPMFVRTQIGGEFAVILYVLAIIYAAPAFFFAVTIWMSTRNQSQITNHKINSAALVCGMLAVLLHNLIDFAIFEPGIMTAIWACAAILYSGEQKQSDRKLSIAGKYSVAVIAALLIVGIIRYCLFPAAEVSMKMENANTLASRGYFKDAQSLLLKASDDDALNPAPAAAAGKMLVYQFNLDPVDKGEFLVKAEKLFTTAINRDKADFKNYESLAGVYETLAQITSEKRFFWFEKAFTTFKQAVERYPASGELRMGLAQAAEQIGETDCAIENYRKAVETEDAYAEQFKIMYPGKDIFSRLGKIKYQQAKEKLAELTENKK